MRVGLMVEGFEFEGGLSLVGGKSAGEKEGVQAETVEVEGDDAVDEVTLRGD